MSESGDGVDRETIERAVQTAMDGIAVIDEGGVHRYANKPYADCYGFDNSEALVGRRFRTLYDEDETERIESEILPACRQSGQWHGKAVGQRRGGTAFSQELSLSRVTGGGFVCVVRDVTDRQSDRGRLERYETILRNIHDGVYMLDPSGEITWVNETAVEEFDTGYEREELIGSPVSKILDDEDIEKCLSIIKDLVEGEGTSQRCEIDIQTAYGDEIPCELRLGLLPFEDGEFQGTVGVVREITKRKRREQRLSVLNRVLRHNLRNDVTVIAGAASSLANGLDGSRAEQARLIERAGERIVELADQAREIEAALEQRADAREQVEVVEIVCDRCARLRDSYPEATITVEAPEECRALADATLGKVVERLVATAIEYSGASPNVTVTVIAPGSAGRWTVIRVAADEDALSHSDVEVLSEEGETPLQHATGLDLWFVKWLAESYGGELAFEEDADSTALSIRLRVPGRESE